MMSFSEQDKMLTETSVEENVVDQDNVITDSVKVDVSVGIDKTNQSLIVYTSSRSRGACNDTKLNHINENLDFDLSSLQISRRSRSSFPNRARSSVWGCLDNVLPEFKEKSGLDLNLRNRKISLKVKIGNKICSMVNATEEFRESASERNLEKVISSDASVLSAHLDARGVFVNPSSNTSSDNLGASIDIRCSDVGTSPDSEVINSVPSGDVSSSIEAQKKSKEGKKKDKSSEKKGNKNNVEKVDGATDVPSRAECQVAAGIQASSDLGETGASGEDLIGPIDCMQFSSDGTGEQYIPTRKAWVLCDECQKWRRIPALLADHIEETKCQWTCKNNEDKSFADCSIPQEKSNSEINEELEISDASGDEDASGTFSKPKQSLSKVAQQSSWSLIKSNLFLHRSRKTHTIDEVMVCHCKPPSDGRMGCGAKCLNRMLNIECIHGTCPCGELCSNQQFQRRKYVKLKWFKCGKKGYGLQALEDISQGQFLIEYVGEVLDVHVHEARQKEYALNGHKHFYFMTLNGSEVIDACAKGNLGRFINHSCEPNCRTEKWMVNGEVCVGLFSLREIKKGEEVTFDYNYVRVFGAAARKCVCGSPNCRGYIGGDPTNSDVIIQDDSDDEYTEPVMICDDKELDEEWKEIMSNSLINEITNEPLAKIHSMEKPIRHNFVSNDSVSNSVERLKFNKITGESKRKSKSVKKGMSKTNSTVTEKRTPVVDKLNAAVQKSKKLHELRLNSHFEAVEAKLNQLLDSEGGISKRKDASRGYLKLLFLTAASGSNGHGEAIQSTRDLLMILGALLKTKSRTVLVDIINKNGLQMLHNIMKRYRNEFIKTPILRKLLKALEYLATREILTLEHISGGPPCPGVESFKDSILTLTEHADRQVHQTARNFRDRWIPKSLRKNNRMEKNDLRPESHHRSSYGGPSRLSDHRSPKNGKSSDSIISSTNETNGTKIRKRKSRWDIPVDDHPHSRPRTDSTAGDKNPKFDENTLPEFSAPCSNITCNMVLGDLQSRFVSSLPVSYGISCSAVQQCGVRQGERPDEWRIALGVPFCPFPPLPPHRTTSEARCTTSSEPAGKSERFSENCPPRTSSSVDPPKKSVSVDFQQVGSRNLATKFFRQQKSSHSKLAPPWVRSRNGLFGGGLEL
ncbi:histone-lysine n-methyltransferase ashh2 [Phtheirospermum japonicum]|uniref:Histone-lysine n-methyltransferase ashh2 n=1 Tax=Phtheirospermum japonicum TaxID=374723 RepID=A0A830C3A0_9LAMI|nr:histone-lysine n-methyltransferase ashh2 [Phtheirospermum japonicum]